jgi:predicted NBD/HSP70 family sugar kinase
VPGGVRSPQQIELVTGGTPVEAVGIGFAGIIRDGRIEESPNLQQTKGFYLQGALGNTFKAVLVLNDADAMAAGIAATRGKLESLVRGGAVEEEEAAAE